MYIYLIPVCVCVLTVKYPKNIQKFWLPLSYEPSYGLKQNEEFKFVSKKRSVWNLLIVLCSTHAFSHSLPLRVCIVFVIAVALADELQLQRNLGLTSDCLKEASYDAVH